MDGNYEQNLREDMKTTEAISRIKEFGKVTKASKKRMLRDLMRVEKIKGAVTINDPLSRRSDHVFAPPPFKDIASAVTQQTNESRTAFAADRMRELRSKNTDIQQEQAKLATEISKLDDFKAWCLALPHKIERAEGSVFHRVVEGWRAGTLLTQNKAAGDAFFAGDPHIFVIQHNWAGAFAGAADFDGGEWPLPFDRCAFEFQVNGRRCIVLTLEEQGVIAVQVSGIQWLIGSIGSMITPVSEHPSASGDPLFGLNKLLQDNVRALSIALDAEVAVTAVTRAPHRLNSIRERQGKLALSDFHTVSLTHRSRVEPLPSGGEQHEARWHPRMHFRRGHWRHYQNHKTWIKWMLVGNPDLGFIDKHYRA